MRAPARIHPAAVPVFEPLEGRLLLAHVPLEYVECLKDGVGGVEGIDSAMSVALSPDGANVYATGYLDRAISVFSRDAATGQLTFLQVLTDGVGGVDGLAGAIGLEVSPDGKNVYATGYLDNAIAAFSRDTATGQLTFLQVLKDGVGGVEGLAGATGLTVSRDGQNVYVAAMGDNALSVFSRNAATGQLTFVQALQDGVGGVDGLAGACTPTLNWYGEVTGHPDYVDVASKFDNAITVFRRNMTTGQLTYVQTLKDGAGGVDGIAGAVSATVYGDSVYVAGQSDNAVAVFRQDEDTGQLTFVQMVKDGVGGVTGLQGTQSVTWGLYGFPGSWGPGSDNAIYIYAIGNVSNALAVFSRDASSGQLTFVQALVDGQSGIDGLAGAHGAVATADGNHVYTVGSVDDAVALFRYNTAPTLAPNVSLYLAPIESNNGNPEGISVRSLVLQAGTDLIVDPDGGPEGIAVWAVVNAGGTWQYSLDIGAHWSDFGSVSLTAAKLLPADDNTYVRTVPTAGVTTQALLVFGAWDQTSGAAGGSGDMSTRGGRTAFSSECGDCIYSAVTFNTALGRGRPLKAVYTDNDGTKVTISAKGAAAFLSFTGQGVAESVSKGTVNVTGAGLVLRLVSLVDTTAASRLTISTKGGDRAVQVGEIFVAQPLGAFSAPGVDLIGALTAMGGLGQLTLDSVTRGHRIWIGSSPGIAGAKMQFGTIGDATLVSLTPITSLVAYAIAPSIPDAYEITAPSFGSVTLTASLVNAQIRSEGSIGSVCAGRIESSSILAGVNEDVTRLPDSAADFAAQATLGRLTVGAKSGYGFMDSCVAAWSLGTVALKAVETDNSQHESRTLGLAGHTVASLTHDGARLRGLVGPGTAETAHDYVVRLV